VRILTVRKPLKVKVTSHPPAGARRGLYSKYTVHTVHTVHSRISRDRESDRDRGDRGDGDILYYFYMVLNGIVWDGLVSYIWDGMAWLSKYSVIVAVLLLLFLYLFFCFFVCFDCSSKLDVCMYVYIYGSMLVCKYRSI